MHDHEKALHQILDICSESRTYTRRTQLINNVAMKALGMTANQRHEVHIKILERLGDEPMKQRYLERRAKNLAKIQAYLEEKGISSEAAA